MPVVGSQQPLFPHPARQAAGPAGATHAFAARPAVGHRARPSRAEMVEWGGWALAAWPSLPAAAFAAFTFFNLAPRGWRHHLWYKQRFPRYPRERRAVIPFLW